MTKFKEAGLDIEISRPAIVAEVLNKIQSSLGAYFVRKLTKEEILKCACLFPTVASSTSASVASLPPKKMKGMKKIGSAAGGNHFRYVVVPESVAIDKTKQSIRFQLKVMQKNGGKFISESSSSSSSGGGGGIPKTAAAAAKKSMMNDSITFSPSPRPDKEVDPMQVTPKKLSSSPIAAPIAPLNRNSPAATTTTSFSFNKDGRFDRRASGSNGAVGNGSGGIIPTSGLASLLAAGSPLLPATFGAHLSSRDRLLQLVQEEQKYTNLLHASVFGTTPGAAAAASFGRTTLPSGSTGNGVSDSTANQASSKDHVLDPYRALLGVGSRRLSGGLAPAPSAPTLLPRSALMLPTTTTSGGTTTSSSSSSFTSATNPHSHHHHASASAAAAAAAATMDRNSLLRMIVERTDEIVRETS